jgi:hypothetical protein
MKDRNHDREAWRNYAFYTNVASTASSREEHERMIEAWVDCIMRYWEKHGF